MNPAAQRDSDAYCHQLMRTSARNFYFGMRLLPQAKREAMYALYSFMRLIDDIADDDTGEGVCLGTPCTPVVSRQPTADQPVRPTSPLARADTDLRRQRLEHWRTLMHGAVDGDTGGHLLWPAFADAVRRFQIPVHVFDEAIDGQLQDLVQVSYATFDDLYRYCYRVASTVGIAAVHVWGFQQPAVIKLAEERGIAMQLTNILRDIREDACRGRTYLPAEDLLRYGCDQWNPASSGSAPPPPAFDELMRFEITRARDYYERSAPLEDLVEPDSRPTLRIMTGIYRGILERINANPRAVLSRRVGLSTIHKLLLVARHAWQGHRARLEGTP